MAFANGSFGLEMLDQYMVKLENFHTLGLADLRMEAFISAILVMGEIWRRFVYERDCFPFKLWNLLTTKSDQEFLEMYCRFQKVKVQCPVCCDIEFTHPFLNILPESGSDDPLNDATASKIRAMKALLLDLSIFTPLSSDLVECLHGFSQAKCHRFRGCKPSDDVATELTLWSSIVSSFKSFREHVWSKLGDYKINFRLHRLDKRGSNGFSRANAENPDKTKYKKGATRSVWSSKMNLSGICAASGGFVRAPRALSGPLGGCFWFVDHVRTMFSSTLSTFCCFIKLAEHVHSQCS